MFYVENFITYNFNLDSHNNNNSFIIFLKIIINFLIFIYHILLFSK